MEWENRKMDFKVTDRTGKTNFYLYILAIERENTKYDRLFRWYKGQSIFPVRKTISKEIQWESTDHIPGNHKMWYAPLEGAVPMGICRIEPGGYFKLHWHNGEKITKLSKFQISESEHYLIVSGHGRFTVGDEERDIKAGDVSINRVLYNF